MPLNFMKKETLLDGEDISKPFIKKGRPVLDGERGGGKELRDLGLEVRKLMCSCSTLKFYLQRLAGLYLHIAAVADVEGAGLSRLHVQNEWRPIEVNRKMMTLHVPGRFQEQLGHDLEECEQRLP